MIRSSSSVLRRTVPAVGALVAAAVLTACGGTAHPGAAAVVGQNRISVSAVQARMAEYRSEAAAVGAAAGQQEPNDLAQSTLSQMVMSRVVDYAVTWYGLSVSDTEVAQLRANQKQAWGGEPVMEQALLVKRGVAAGQIDDFYREQLGLGKLAAMSGKQLGTADGNKVVHALLASASAELKVTVNPRYGSWDAQQSIVSTSLDPWLPQTGTAA